MKRKRRQTQPLTGFRPTRTSQWAYMLSVPKVWEKTKDKLGKAIAAGNRIWPKGVGGVSIFRHGEKAFNEKINDLFLTAKEKTSA